MKLVKASLDPPKGLDAFLEEVGNGESGFGGTDYVKRELGEYLQRLVDSAEGKGLSPGLVAQSTYWFLDDDGSPVGMCRLRHSLTPGLKHKGGHIGYYVKPSARGKGYGKAMLAAALREAKEMRVTRVLVTTDSVNAASIRVIEANGGILEDELPDVDTRTKYKRYWVDLSG